MTDNNSLRLSIMFREQLSGNLFPAFKEEFPEEKVNEYVSKQMSSCREKVYTPINTIYTMLLSSVQEDKSYQQATNLFSSVHESQSKKWIEEEQKMLEAERITDSGKGVKKGRPKLYKSKLQKSKLKPLSSSPVAYNNARKRLPLALINEVFETTTHWGALEKEIWYGFRTHIADGSYLQLQDIESIREVFPSVESNGKYPQALLQVMVRQGGGQIVRYALASRRESELKLVIPMIKELKQNDLLLADDLYNTYYNFCLILQQQAQIIVPGKRERNYTVVEKIAEGDEIVEIKKTVRPRYVSREEWDTLPGKIRLRRISYRYPTQNGMADSILYTTLLNPKIGKTDIVLKYATRWDVEISIREIKTLMDINVLRSKSPEMIAKELAIALTAYNMVRKIIAKSAERAAFSPETNIFQKCPSFNRSVLLDSKGRVFHHWSSGRHGRINERDRLS
jgi:hypothetical protein